MISRPKHPVRYLLIATTPLVLAIPLFFWLSGHRGRRAIETWVGRQLIAIANQYLTPQLSFATLEYQYPRTIFLTNVRLTATDPRSPGSPIDILVVKNLTLDLAEIPRRGQPIRIQQLHFDQPELRFIAAGNGQFGVLGFSHLLRTAADSAAPSDQVARLSSYFEMNLLQLHNALVVYDPRESGEVPMELDQINAHLDIKSTAQTGEPGWYALDLKLDRAPVFTCQLTGRMNLDTAVLDLKPLQLAMTLNRQQDHFLPPSIQESLRAHEITGQLALHIQGTLPLAQWQTAQLNAHLQLTDGQFAMGNNRLPVQNLDAVWSMGHGLATLDSLAASLLGGKLNATGHINFATGNEAGVDLTLQHLRLEQALRNATGGEGDYRGDLTGEIVWQAPLGHATRDSGGAGAFSVVNARLESFPIVGQLVKAIRSVIKIVGMDTGDAHDTATAVFTFQGDRANFTQLDIATSWSLLRGHGDVYFDQRLNLQFNGGPLEKGESLLGGLGKMIGKATDEVAAYIMTGTLDKPEVNIKIAPGLH